MKKTEVALVVLFLLGILLSMVPVSGGLLLIILSGSLLSILYFAFSFWIFNNIRVRDIFKKTAYSEVTAAKTILSIFAGLNISVAVVGIQFRLMLWKGSHAVLVAGLANIVIMLIILVLMALLNKRISYRPYFIRVSLLGILNLVLLTTSGINLIEIRYRKHPAYVELYREHLADPANAELRQRLFDMEQTIREQHKPKINI